MFPGTVSTNGRSKMGAVQQTLPRSKHKFPAPAPPQIPKNGGGRSPAGSSTTTTTATPSPVSRFSRAPHWPTEAIPKRVKKLSWDDRNSCAHMTVSTNSVAHSGVFRLETLFPICRLFHPVFRWTYMINNLKPSSVNKNENIINRHKMILLIVFVILNLTNSIIYKHFPRHSRETHGGPKTHRGPQKHGGKRANKSTWLWLVINLGKYASTIIRMEVLRMKISFKTFKKNKNFQLLLSIRCFFSILILNLKTFSKKNITVYLITELLECGH